MTLSDYFARRRVDGGPADVREPAVAGRFYPGEPDTLRLAVDTLLAHARSRPPDVRAPLVVVAPHAGYAFSGQIAADALAQARGEAIDLVVLLGTAHTRAGAGAMSVYPGAAFVTPLGAVPVDRDARDALVEAAPFVRPDSAAHQTEHSIEVLVPFVQVLFPRATMLPVVVGLEDAGECERLGRAVGRVIRDRRALVAASSDLSHYPSAEHARWSDAAVLERMVDLDLPALSQRAGELVTSRVPNLMTAACGLGPVLVAMAVAAEAGARDARVVSYANSSEVAIGDAERVVGYGAVSFSPGVPRADAQVVQNHAPAGPDRLDDEDRRALLALARATITQFLDSETLPLPRDVPTHLQALHHGAFVTLREHGQLRGCIGRVWHDGPLPQLVSAMAYEAAFQDPRFGPVAADEVDDLAVEVSVLTPPQPAEAEAIEPGRHGVLLRKHGRSAVFLPKVATEQGWDREQLLDHLCLKGGLPARAWTRDASLFTFEAEVFGEGAHG